MPSLAGIISRFTDQTILYWEAKGADGFGKLIFANPVPIKVRLESKSQEVILPDGRKVMSHGYVLSSVVMTVGSFIWEGTLEQWSSTIGPAIPTVNQGGREIIKVNSTPGFRQLTGFVTEAFL